MVSTEPGTAHTAATAGSTATSPSSCRRWGALCTRFAIPRVYPAQPFRYYGDALRAFEGVIGHANVRPVPVAPSPQANGAATPLTPAEQRALFEGNAGRLDRLDVAAGSLVKSLLMALERRDVLLRLHDPAPGGHTVGYSVVQGDAGSVRPLARVLGFKRVTDERLEVHDA